MLSEEMNNYRSDWFLKLHFNVCWVNQVQIFFPSDVSFSVNRFMSNVYFKVVFLLSLHGKGTQSEHTWHDWVFLTSLAHFPTETKRWRCRAAQRTFFSHQCLHWTPGLTWQEVHLSPDRMQRRMKWNTNSERCPVVIRPRESQLQSSKEICSPFLVLYVDISEGSC